MSAHFAALIPGQRAGELGGQAAEGVQEGVADTGRAIAVGAAPQKHYTVQQQPAAGSCHYRYEHGEPLEDPTCTPGAISPAVTQANLASTIRRKGGYTSGIRPCRVRDGQGEETECRLLRLHRTHGRCRARPPHQPATRRRPNDYRNLWVEPADPGHRSGSGVNNNKDPVETKLHTTLCKDQITLAAAQHAIVTNWTTALTTLPLT